MAVKTLTIARLNQNDMTNMTLRNLNQNFDAAV